MITPTTPDEKAAAFDPEVPPASPVENIGDLLEKHIGAQIEVFGVRGELINYSHELNGTTVVIREADRPFDTTTGCLSCETPCAILADDPVLVTDVIGMDDFYALARELDRVSEEIRSNDSATKALKERKRQLSEKLLGTFAQVGQETLAFDDRRAYIHHELYPEFEEKGDGSKYTLTDLVPVLKALGRAEQVTPETVNYRTMQGILREIRDGAIPMPEELAAMVKIGEKVEVRTGVGRKTR